jgi:hypothetical protein
MPPKRDATAAMEALVGQAAANTPAPTEDRPGTDEGAIKSMGKQPSQPSPAAVLKGMGKSVKMGHAGAKHPAALSVSPEKGHKSRASGLSPLAMRSAKSLLDVEEGGTGPQRARFESIETARKVEVVFMPVTCPEPCPMSHRCIVAACRLAVAGRRASGCCRTRRSTW